jgi:hypothetical protein
MRRLLLIITLLVFTSCENLFNSPPAIPSTPDGPSIGIIDTSYNFMTSTTDPEEDNISYQFDFGFGDTSIWSSFRSSGDIITWSHSFSSPGQYLVRARATDIFGNISEWSLPHQIIISGNLIY